MGAHGPGERYGLRSADPVRWHAGARPSHPGMSAVLRPAALPAEHWRRELAAGRQALREAYFRQPNPRLLLRRHSHLIDGAVKALWDASEIGAGAALVATGGYGRGELFPCSDIDLLVLLPGEPGPSERESVERLIGTFWDIGLEIGHSVRTVEGCIEAAEGDITIRTTLLESRYLAGSRKQFATLQKRFTEALDPVAFLKAKTLEQEQ